MFSMDGKHKQVEGFIDYDFASDLDKRRLATGYVFIYGGSPVSWKSALQCTVTLSTTEVEYMVVVEAAKESLWLLGEISWKRARYSVYSLQ